MDDERLDIPVDYVRFRQREDRSGYIVDRFGACLADSILDVGCDQAVLKRLLPQVRYVGLDIGGAPDLKLDLDGLERLPFEDGSFHCVVCSDVLEHLEHLHRMFGELIRVARRYVVLSLPNCWVAARVPIQRGRGEFAHYGLPVDPPPDRHRWFFSLQQARHFVHAQARRHTNVRIAQERITEKPRFVLLRALRRLRYRARFDYANRYAHTYWAVLEKT